MCDWTEFDISTISEIDFPIRCDHCGYELSGLGDRGRCPQCAGSFVRRKLLWNMYGPEAFASPAIKPSDENATPADRSFVYGLIWALVLTLTLPIVLLAWVALFGKSDLCLGLSSWLVVAASLEWIVWRRREEHVTECRPDEDDPPG